MRIKAAVLRAKDAPYRIEDVQTGAGAILNSLAVTVGSSVIVFGAGGVGLSAVMAARVVGAATIVAVDLNPARLELARGLGATHVFDGARDDLLLGLVRATGGAQYSLDTTGLPSVILTAVNALRPTGVCGLVDVQQGDLVLDPMVLVPGRTVKGVLEGDAVPQVFVPRLIALWRQGWFPFDRLITTFPMDRINEAEQATLKGEAVKPVLIPQFAEEGAGCLFHPQGHLPAVVNPQGRLAAVVNPQGRLAAVVKRTGGARLPWARWPVGPRCGQCHDQYLPPGRS